MELTNKNNGMVIMKEDLKVFQDMVEYQVEMYYDGFSDEELKGDLWGQFEVWNQWLTELYVLHEVKQDRSKTLEAARRFYTEECDRRYEVDYHNVPKKEVK